MRVPFEAGTAAPTGTPRLLVKREREEEGGKREEKERKKERRREKRNEQREIDIFNSSPRPKARLAWLAWHSRRWWLVAGLVQKTSVALDILRKGDSAKG